MTQELENYEANSAETVTEDSACSPTILNPLPLPLPTSDNGNESTQGNPAGPKPPNGYEGTPPELWPGPDGKPPVLTEALMRKLRGKYFTVKHPVLQNCGHKFDTINEPKNNCENCWFQFFNTHPGLVEVTDQFRRTQGRGPLVGMRGKKYVVMFERYMATIIALMQQERAIRDSQKRNGDTEAASTTTTANEAAPADQSGSGSGDGSGNQGLGEAVRGN